MSDSRWPGEAYACGLQHFAQSRVVAHARVEDGDAGVEELHAGAEGGDAALEGVVRGGVHVDWGFAIVPSSGVVSLLVACFVWSRVSTLKLPDSRSIAVFRSRQAIAPSPKLSATRTASPSPASRPPPPRLYLPPTDNKIPSRCLVCLARSFPRPSVGTHPLNGKRWTGEQETDEMHSATHVAILYRWYAYLAHEFDKLRREKEKRGKKRTRCEEMLIGHTGVVIFYGIANFAGVLAASTSTHPPLASILILKDYSMEERECHWVV